MVSCEPPEWLGRMILCDELRHLGLPFVPEAMWRRPNDGWLTFTDTLDAVSMSSAIVWAIRRRGIPCGDELRSAVWRCTVAGLGLLPREAWPTNRQHVADVADEPEASVAELPQADKAVADEPLVIRRQGAGRRHAK